MAKTFTSQSLNHLGSYSAVKSTVSYVLSYRYLAVLATYAIALANFFQDNVIAKLPVATDLLKLADAKFDSIVLANVDAFLASDIYKKLEHSVVSYKKKADETFEVYKKKVLDVSSAVQSRVQAFVAPVQQKLVAQKTKISSVLSTYKTKLESTVSSYLKPVNDYVSSTVDKVLPKGKKAAEQTKATADNEFSKSIDIFNDTVERSKELISSKSSEVTNAVVSTYNKEFETTPEKNYYVKVASASVNTGVTLLKNVNSEYIKPLKETTQSYVSETIAQSEGKAEQLVADSKKAAEDVNVKLNNASNGAVPVVSASA